MTHRQQHASIFKIDFFQERHFCVEHSVKFVYFSQYLIYLNDNWHDLYIFNYLKKY